MQFSDHKPQKQADLHRCCRYAGTEFPGLFGEPEKTPKKSHKTRYFTKGYN
jgi:hypothetical protein